MIAFAELLERLLFTPSRNAKVALLRRYFETQPDPDRGIGLAAVTGELSFTAAKPGLIRELAAARAKRETLDTELAAAEAQRQQRNAQADSDRDRAAAADPRNRRRFPAAPTR